MKATVCLLLLLGLGAATAVELPGGGKAGSGSGEEEAAGSAGGEESDSSATLDACIDVSLDKEIFASMGNLTDALSSIVAITVALQEGESAADVASSITNEGVGHLCSALNEEGELRGIVENTDLWAAIGKPVQENEDCLLNQFVRLIPVVFKGKTWEVVVEDIRVMLLGILNELNRAICTTHDGEYCGYSLVEYAEDQESSLGCCAYELETAASNIVYYLDPITSIILDVKFIAAINKVIPGAGDALKVVKSTLEQAVTIASACVGEQGDECEEPEPLTDGSGQTENNPPEAPGRVCDAEAGGEEAGGEEAGSEETGGEEAESGAGSEAEEPSE